MGAPTSEVGYTIATTRKENHEVHKNGWWHWREKNNEEVMQNVQEWLQWQPKDFFLRDIRKLLDRWRKSSANQGG
jgi:hypothetical protein